MAVVPVKRCYQLVSVCGLIDRNVVLRFGHLVRNFRIRLDFAFDHAACNGNAKDLAADLLDPIDSLADTTHLYLPQASENLGGRRRRNRDAANYEEDVALEVVAYLLPRRRSPAGRGLLEPWFFDLFRALRSLALS